MNIEQNHKRDRNRHANSEIRLSMYGRRG